MIRRRSIIDGAAQYIVSNGWKPFPFQVDAWREYENGKSGLVNAPTGSGKTYSLLLPILLGAAKRKRGLRAIWVTPIRALTKEIYLAATRVVEALELEVSVAIRSGDTSSSERSGQFRDPPDFLITTPESLHVILSTRGYSRLLQNLESVVIDEWHELIGSKRGVMVELALSRFKGLRPALRIWGISATIGNMDEAVSVLHGKTQELSELAIIKADLGKKIEVISIEPDDINKFPWAGYIGIRLLAKILPILHESATTLIFTNTRSQCEIWYHALLEQEPSLAGLIAMHHSSIGREIRDWVEDALYSGSLKAVVSTSSLDLGVDFRPVETVIQVGSPKGVARFMQRAGRSGHQPGAVSRIYFIPTHALELIEGAALREAINQNLIEDRIPFVRSFDVLIQYLMTLAVSEGFVSSQLFREIGKTHCFESITEFEWNWILNFLTHGGSSLGAYDEYQRLYVDNHVYRVINQRIARRHKLSIGTIVSDAALEVRHLNGKKLGTIEESFISRLEPGDNFWFGGKNLEFLRIKDMTALVRPSFQKNGKVPSWQGGRMALSSQMSKVLRQEIYKYKKGLNTTSEFKKLSPILDLQLQISHLPDDNDFLIEQFETEEGFHLVMYPFEGRFVHEGMSILIAKRLSKYRPFTFSLAMNDYGFELLTDRKVPIEEAINDGLFETANLWSDIQRSMNSVEMARRKFRDIARIAGLVFAGYPGKQKKDRHLQASSEIIFDVFESYEPDNLLYLQTFEEVMNVQLEEQRLRQALGRIENQEIFLVCPPKPTPLSFPIMVDRLREKFTNEALVDRVQKMKLDLTG